MNASLLQAQSLAHVLSRESGESIPPELVSAVTECAVNLQKLGQHVDCWDLCEAALHKVRPGSPAQRTLNLIRARTALLLSDFESAQQIARQVIEQIANADDPQSIQATIMLASALWPLNRVGDALDLLSTVRVRLLSKPDSAELAACSNGIAAALGSIGEWDQASMMAMDAIVSARRVGDSASEAHAWANLGFNQRGQARFARAQESFQKSLSLFETDGWAQWALRVRHSRSLVLWKLGRLSDASQELGHVISESRQMGFPTLSQNADLLAALIAIHRGAFVEAGVSLESATLRESRGHSRSAWLRDEFLADISIEQGEFDSSLLALDSLLLRVRALAPRGDVACEIQRRRAECLLHLGKVESGIEAVREAESIARECGDVYELACSLRVLALLLARSGKPVEAQGAFAKAFQIFDEIQTPYEWGKLWMSYGDWLGSAHSGHYFSMRAAHDAYRAAIEHFDGMRAEYKLGEAQRRLVELEGRLKDEGDQAASDAEIRPRPRRRPVRDIELQRRVQWAYETFGLVTRHKPFLDMLDQIAALAVSEIPMLVLGESGTGKERIAHGIHTLSGRTGEYVAINCSAIQPTMLEAELFGYVRGAFTGADRDKPGLFESADRGTVFLDEIGEMSVDLQAKLLRFLENGSLRRIGATSDTRVRVRLLAATNRDQAKLASGDGFRSDLYFRLAHAVFTLPPLRERGDDAEVLIDHFLEVFGEDEGKRIRLSSASREQVLDYTWPGNIRQLRAMVHRLVAQSKDGHVIVPRELQLDDAGAPRNFLEEMEEQERKRILEALEKSSGVKADAARMLRLSRTTMLAKMKRYKIPM